VIPPIVWIPAGFVLGLGLVLWAGMSWAYDRGGRHAREEAEAVRAAAVFRRMPRVPAHDPPGPFIRPGAPPRPTMADKPGGYLTDEHIRQALQLANAVPDPHPSGPMRRLEPLPPAGDMTDSAFTRTMRDEVARGMAMVEAILRGEP
jgi:hypothetical protein